jgi:hypothetical protein
LRVGDHQLPAAAATDAGATAADAADLAVA